MTIRADDIAFLYLKLNRLHCHTNYGVKREHFACAISVIKVHDVIRILNTTVRARPRLRLSNKISTSRVCARIPVKILALIVFVVTARERLPAISAVGMASSSRAISEVVFRGWLISLTLRADFPIPMIARHRYHVSDFSMMWRNEIRPQPMRPH